MNMTGPGEARRLTDLSTGAGAPVWSPDGKYLAFESMVFPGAADDEANQEAAEKLEEREYNASVYDGFPIRHWDHWRDEKQVHLFVQPVDGGGEARDLFAGTELVSQPGYSGSPSLSDEELEAEGGEPERLSGDDAGFGQPTFSPDGGHLYSLRRPITDFAYNLTRIARFEWPELGSLEVLAESFDRPVGDFVFAPDGDAVYAIATEAGRRRVFEIAADGSDVRLLDDDRRGVYAGPQAGGAGDATTLVARFRDLRGLPSTAREMAPFWEAPSGPEPGLAGRPPGPRVFDPAPPRGRVSAGPNTRGLTAAAQVTPTLWGPNGIEAAGLRAGREGWESPVPPPAPTGGSLSARLCYLGRSLGLIGPIGRLCDERTTAGVLVRGRGQESDRRRGDDDSRGSGCICRKRRGVGASRWRWCPDRQGYGQGSHTLERRREGVGDRARPHPGL
jgi:hypothetical protein